LAERQLYVSEFPTEKAQKLIDNASSIRSAHGNNFRRSCWQAIVDEIRRQVCRHNDGCLAGDDWYYIGNPSMNDGNQSRSQCNLVALAEHSHIHSIVVFFTLTASIAESVM